LKQGINSSTTKTYLNQLVVPRASLASLRLPNYAWIVMVLMAMALLATTAIYREREGLRSAQASFNRTQQKFQEAQLNNELLRKDLRAMQQDKNVIAREAQTKLNYVRPNEVLVVVR
jgi:cell division protein FtsB